MDTHSESDDVDQGPVEARELGGREAADLAQAAQSAARRRRTPRLMSLLHAREAVGHALLGDPASARRAFRLARQHVADDRHDDDPLWLDFWGPADLASHEMLAGRYLGDAVLAESAARQALSESDRIAYPRNHVMYSLDLAGALSAQGKLDEAVPLIADAMTRSTELHSARAKATADSLITELSRMTDAPTVRELVGRAASSPPSPQMGTGYPPWLK